MTRALLTIATLDLFYRYAGPRAYVRRTLGVNVHTLEA